MVFSRPRCAGRLPAHAPAWLVVACLASAWSSPGTTADFGRVLHGLAAPFKPVHQEPPPPPCDDPLERLSRQIAWLDHHLRTHGSIVAKEPDVWGQRRLMRHRVETERHLERQLDQFSERTSASLRRSDQAYLALAMALQSASGRRRISPEVTVPEVTGSGSVINAIQGLVPSGNEPPGRSDPQVIVRSAPPAPGAPGFRFDDGPLALEPTVHLDQLSRYLNHLHALRRVNEGDDSADAPGYALALVRIPVSIDPGSLTRKGHGAEISFLAEPILGDDLLPTTFRNLVINDLVDVVAPALTWCINDPECVAWADTIVGASDVATTPEPRGVMAALEALSARLPSVSPAPPPSLKTRRARLPIPFSQLAEISGTRQIAILIRDTRQALVGHPAANPCANHMLVRSHLDEEAKAAADFLAEDTRRSLWAELPGWNLAGLIRGRRTTDLEAMRCRFFSSIGAGNANEPSDPGLWLPTHDGVAPLPWPGLSDPRCCVPEPPSTPACATTTAVLAWGLLVESALLNERLLEDMRESATARGEPASPTCSAGPFFGPDPSPEARAAFNDYVRRRWPLRVFALDPVRDEQNVDDTFSRRREMQIALAAATASGRLNAQALARFTRRMETDLATVALNQTAVGFAHGSDTFGWRFYPRVQTPPTRSTFAALGETFLGGPTSDADLTQRKLEPGMRECTAILVFPAFVPFVRFDSHSTFFALAHPRSTEPSIRRTLQFSRAVQAMRSTQDECLRCPGLHGVAHLPQILRQVDRLERRLPLQSLEARIPHENTAGGFELFATGVSDLAPELVGWFGAPGIDPAGTTTLFLAGKGFSVHDTRVLAGGRPAAFRLLSRELMEVTVPPGTLTLPARGGDCLPASDHSFPGSGVLPTAMTETLPAPVSVPWPSTNASDCNRREVVEIQLATPYGVSGTLLVPVVRSSAAEATMPRFEAGCAIGLTFTTARVTGSQVPQSRVDEFFSSGCDAIMIRVPSSFIPPTKAELALVLRDTSSGETAAVLAFPNPFFDARRRGYVIAGGDLRNFVGDTSRPATDKTLRGAVKPYLDRLLQRGMLAEVGDRVVLDLTASIVAGQQEVPIEGGLTVRCTRRGLTAGEPAAQDAVGLEGD
jgi:hypothetical protein